MNQKIYLPIIYLTLAIAVMGCQPSPTTTPTGTPEPPTLTPLPTSTFTITPTLPSPTIALTLQGSDHLIVNCLEILPSLPEDVELIGQIYLEGAFLGYGKWSGPDSKLDNKTIIPIPIPLLSDTHPLVSPNGQRVMYLRENRDESGNLINSAMVIKDAFGKVVTARSHSLGFRNTYWYWLDNDRIVSAYLGDPIVWDIATDKYIYIRSEWLDLAPGGLMLDAPTWGVNALYDSQLGRVFYRNNVWKMWLWDIEAKQILAELTGTDDSPLDRPKWAWDDSQIVLAFHPDDPGYPYRGQELFSVSRDGQIRQLTELGKDYYKVLIQEFIWSPDGSKIAFFFDDEFSGNTTYHLAILNMDTLTVTDYCDLGGFSDPIWSPDSQMLLIGHVETDKETYSTILLDLVNGYAATLVKDLVPSGWMVAP